VRLARFNRASLCVLLRTYPQQTLGPAHAAAEPHLLAPARRAELQFALRRWRLFESRAEHGHSSFRSLWFFYQLQAESPRLRRLREPPGRQQRRAPPQPGHTRLNPEAPRLSRVPRAGAVRDEGIALVKALVAGAGVLGAVPAEFRAAMFQGAA